MMPDDCGFRDQRDVDRYYGICPDCGDPKGPRCHCREPEDEERGEEPGVAPPEASEYPF